MTGHAVRMLYYCCGGADLVAETGDPEYRAALDRLWANMTGRRMYVTGGMGSRWEGEAFGADYELPNDRSYAETCAAIGSVMWNWRMLLITGEGRFADAIEIAGRVSDCGSRIILTADEGRRGGKTVALKKNVDDALAKVGGVLPDRLLVGVEDAPRVGERFGGG